MVVTATQHSCPSAGGYSSRRPEQSLLYRMVAEHFEDFRTKLNSDGGGLPKRAEEEFRAFLACGIPEHGVVLRRSLAWNFAHLIAFSCRKRGFCPSCVAKRSSFSAAHLVDHVIPPHVPLRHWTVPKKG